MIIDKAFKIKEEYEKLTLELANPSLINNKELYYKKVKEHGEYTPIVEKLNEYLKLKELLKDAEEIEKSESDPEIKKLAEEDIKNYTNKIQIILNELQYLLLPKNPDDIKNAIFEIRAGTGGEEAALFASDLYRMYSKYAEKKGFKIDIIDSSPTELGGFKEIIFIVQGQNAYGIMKFESGTHRVQRVPTTEASGRIHTSAATVAVLPEQEEIDFQLKPEDLKIEVCRASGAGGQHVNRTESAVRIVHIPTGIEVRCQDDRSQIKNREKALKILTARVKNKLEMEEKAKIDNVRRIQIGTGDRSEKIRTYNFPQNRVTDHRIGLTLYNLNNILDGELDELLSKLAEEHNKKLLEKIIK
ncbi:MAG: peptide chain release factor 1 [Candidatus Goldbacteria bacterium]|nr:peptide chain release factor 1 [Candidatus Goldiibacteriota bacterium]